MQEVIVIVQYKHAAGKGEFVKGGVVVGKAIHLREGVVQQQAQQNAHSAAVHAHKDAICLLFPAEVVDHQLLSLLYIQRAFPTFNTYVALAVFPAANHLHVFVMIFVRAYLPFFYAPVNLVQPLELHMRNASF